MKTFKVFILKILILGSLNAQCFEIESILVDACGSPESNNEMLIFKVGNAPLNVNNMTVSWPNNPFLGICQNAITANNVAYFNSTVQSCGYFLEPVNGVLPANKRVFLFTSTNIVQSAHTFPNLSDTVIALFQCPGATSGHFANYDGNPGLRTTVITFSQPSGCTDTVTYNKINLININGGFGGGSALQNGATVLFSPNGTPTYINPGCNPQYVPFTISINNPPTTACPGNLLFLSGSATGQVYSVQWSGGNGTILGSGLLNPSYQVVAADAGGFTLTMSATDVCGTTLSATANINVPIQQPLDLNPSGNVSICQGQSINLNVSGGSGTYSWSSGQNTSQITVNVAGTYIVNSSDACYSYTDSVVVAATPTPVLNLSPNGTQTLCQGSSLQITANSNISPVQWNGGQTGTIVNVTSGGVYVASVSNSCGTVSDSLEVIISNLPDIAVSPSNTLSICAGGSGTLTVSGAQNIIWSTGSTAITETFSSTGSYWVAGINSCGTDTVHITVSELTPPVAEISIQGDTILCPGETITLTSVNGSNNDQWSTGVSGQQITISNAPVTVILTVSNACGSATDIVSITAQSFPQASITTSTGNTVICTPNSLELTASGGNNYSWNTGATSATISVTNPGNYTVTTTNECGTDSETIIITAGSPPNPQITTSSGSTFCTGDSLLLTASGGVNYLWSTNETTPSIYVSTGGVYNVTAFNDCGSAQNSITINQIPLPDLNIITPGPVNLCEGSQVTIEATSNANITWSNGATGNQIVVNSGGLLTATASNTCGSSSSTILINEVPMPSADIVQNSPLISCEESISLDVMANGNIQWNTGSTASSIIVSSSGYYSVTVSNACGQDTDSIQVIISGPEASFTADPTTGNAPMNVIFTSTSTGATSLQWDVNGTSYNTLSFNHVFNLPGNYDVTLIAMDDLGCSDTATIKIVVGDIFELFIPNVFTPNGDGLNDEFKIVGTGIKEFKCTIFNRWGNELFTWEDMFQGWDGNTMFGKKASSGVYVYLAEIRDLNGETKTIYGTVTLFE